MNDPVSRTRAQRQHNAEANAQPLNVSIGNYVMVRTDAKHEHKLQAQWHGSILIKEAKSNLVFIAEDLINAKQQTMHPNT